MAAWICWTQKSSRAESGASCGNQQASTLSCSTNAIVGALGHLDFEAKLVLQLVRVGDLGDALEINNAQRRINLHSMSARPARQAGTFWSLRYVSVQPSTSNQRRFQFFTNAPCLIRYPRQMTVDKGTVSAPCQDHLANIELLHLGAC